MILIGKEILLKGCLLAELPEIHADGIVYPAKQFIWFPEATPETITPIRKKIAADIGKGADFTLNVKVYNLSEYSHYVDYYRWKEALETRTMTFSKCEYIIYAENVAKMEPKGYIVYVKDEV